jgi:hypothetical protein
MQTLIFLRKWPQNFFLFLIVHFSRNLNVFFVKKCGYFSFNALMPIYANSEVKRARTKNYRFQLFQESVPDFSAKRRNISLEEVSHLF